MSHRHLIAIRTLVFLSVVGTTLFSASSAHAQSVTGNGYVLSGNAIPVTNFTSGGGYNAISAGAPITGAGTSGTGFSNTSGSSGGAGAAGAATPTPVPSSGGGGGGGGGGGSGASFGNINATPPPTTTSTSTSTPSTTWFFRDTVGHWGLKYINALKKNCDSIEGYRDAKGNLLHEFRPNNPITRAELVTMIVRCSYGSLPAAMEQPFKDVATETFYSGYIKKALDLGWISGYADHSFKPNQSVTRAEALKIILRSQFSAAEIANGAPAAGFTDVVAGGWYSNFVYFAASNGFMEGYRDKVGNLTGKFGPGNNMTRAEVAKVIVKVKGWNVEL